MKNFDWTKWSAIAEISAALAIVVTLMVLIFQLRANTSALQASTLTSLADRSQQLTIATLSSPQMLATNAELAGFSVEQQSRSLYMLATLRLAEETFLQYQSGLVDEDYLRTRIGLAVTVILGSGAGLEMYELLRNILIPDFRTRLDEIVSTQVANAE